MPDSRSASSISSRAPVPRRSIVSLDVSTLASGLLHPESPIETLLPSGSAEPCTAASNSGVPGSGIARSSFFLRKPKRPTPPRVPPVSGRRQSAGDEGVLTTALPEPDPTPAPRFDAGSASAGSDDLAVAGDGPGVRGQWHLHDSMGPARRRNREFHVRPAGAPGGGNRAGGGGRCVPLRVVQVARL